MPENQRDDLSMVWLVAWRELRDQLRDWRIIFPMFVLTLILPFLADLGAKAAINFTIKYGTPLIAETACTVLAYGGGLLSDYSFSGYRFGIICWGKRTRNN